MVEGEVLAPVVLFPDEIVKAASKAESKKSESGSGSSTSSSTTPAVFFLEQIPALQNACGTIAAIHSVANNLSAIKLKEGSALAAFLAKAKELTPRKRGELLESDSAIEKLHSGCAGTFASGFRAELKRILVRCSGRTNRGAGGRG